MKIYIGFDIGGTFTKGVAVDENGTVIAKNKVKTEYSSGVANIPSTIGKLYYSLLASEGCEGAEILAIGVGVPGIVDTARGVVMASNNLGLFNYDLTRECERLFRLPVKIANDANAAALGEARFGFAGKYKNAVMLTLGTGVGGGIIIDSRLYEGNLGAGAELGHTVIRAGGRKCPCGRHGCLEAYASATALKGRVLDMTKKHPDSPMSKSSKEKDARLAFEYYGEDEYAREIVDEYLEALGCGIVNLANIFRPEVIILGGGVSAAGDLLVKPLSRMLDNEIYGGSYGPAVKIEVARLGNDAGALGAVALVI